MLRKTLLVGLSTAAVTVALASPVSAQNVQSGCGGTTNNVCNVTQTPAQNNSSTVNITSGSGNNVTVNQTGTAEVSEVVIAGNTNTVVHNQSGVVDYARTQIGGNNNDANTRQGADGSFNTATVFLAGNGNSSFVAQGTSANGSSRNTATIVTNGNSVRSVINQDGNGVGTAAATGNTANLNLGGTAAASTTANVFNQSASITQSQNGNSATVAIRGGNTTGATTIAAPQNAGSGTQVVTVTQQNSIYTTQAGALSTAGGAPTATNNPVTNNVADVSLAGQANEATVLQDGVQNSATININRGLAAVSTAVAGAQGRAGAGGQDGGNSVTANQQGQGNRINVSVGGRDTAGQQGLGNILTINQGAAGAAGRGTGHSATVFQFGQLSDITVTQNDNTPTVGTTARQTGSTADISQSSFYSSISLTQNGGNDAIISQGGGTSVNNNIAVRQNDVGSIAAGVGGGGAFPPTTPGAGARHFVNISQAGGTTAGGGFAQLIDVNQDGLAHSATVFQRGGSVNTAVFIAQGSAGVGVNGSAIFNVNAAAAAPNNTGLNQQNTANVDIGGGGQNFVNVAIRQDGANQSATVNQNASNGAISGRLAGGTTEGARAFVSQAGLNQSATVNQTGSNTTATVDQRNGSAAGGSNTQTSVVQITQVGGGSGQTAAGGTLNQNIAIARQINTATGTSVAGAAGTGATGPTGDPDARAAGGYGNRIEIVQTNQSTGTSAAVNGNGGNLYAEAEQRGVGQLARITQTGSNNTAQILQEAAATNAIAIINQSGRNNTFFVTQSAANQFLRSVQTGNNNQTVTASGAGGGGVFTNTGAPGGTFTTTP